MRQREKRRKKTSLLSWVQGLLIAMLVLIPVLYLMYLRTGGASLAPREPVIFTQEDAAAVSVLSRCGCQADTEQALLKPLDWDLRQSGPQVLILHTHATECYTKAGNEDYAESDSFRTLDENYNMLSIGSRVAEILEDHGIAVLHDTEVYDYPSYDDAYDNARAAVEQHLKDYPSIQLILDIHRDAFEDGSGNQMGTYAVVDGETSAQLLFEIGTGCELNNNPTWQENFAVAVKLQAQLEKTWPGLCRDIDLRSSRFNQDLSEGFLLVEVGAAGNTRQEALTAAEALAYGILAISQGANCT